MIQDQVAAGSGIEAQPNWAISATRKSTSEMTQTAIVGALPTFRMVVPLRVEDGKQDWVRATSNTVNLVRPNA